MNLKKIKEIQLDINWEEKDNGNYLQGRDINNNDYFYVPQKDFCSVLTPLMSCGKGSNPAIALFNAIRCESF